MQHRDILIEMVPESSLPDNQMPTPVTAPRVPVMNVPMEAPRAPSLRPTCLLPLDRQTKRWRRLIKKGLRTNRLESRSFSVNTRVGPM